MQASALLMVLLLATANALEIYVSSCARMKTPILDKAAQGLCISSCKFQSTFERAVAEPCQEGGRSLSCAADLEENLFIVHGVQKKKKWSYETSEMMLKDDRVALHMSHPQRE
ncbi:hypothetical protein Tcan_07796 [Toxocara canis]|uniref:Uncharacterized protein n=1 Tax=Toxocara canis TaxID=6265 RepID=A0A0B2VZT3_TOXCA|nr:hypothetical protein Tcan_07796 [Toxocara canis]